jgi:hypothetical protein
MRATWIIGCAVLGLMASGCHAGRASAGYRPTVERRSTVARDAVFEASTGGLFGDGEELALARESGSGDDLGGSDGIEIDVAAESAAPQTTVTGLAIGGEPDLEPAPEPLLLAEAEATRPDASTVGSDASGAAALLVYTARFHVGVYQVHQAQEAIAAAALELGGFVASQTDDGIVVRIPAARFFEAVDRISGTGDVLHRDVRATDVSEEFRDNDIRLLNLEAMRARLDELLARATDVEDALRVERELERVTVELERLRGRQRFLADRISLSTIAVRFRELAREALDQPDTFDLPFSWLRSLGLSSLLRVE